MRSTLIIILAMVLFACGKKTTTEIIPPKQDTTKPDTNSFVKKKVVDMGPHIFNQWLGSTIGSTLPIDTNEIKKAKFKSFANYEKVNEKVKELKYFDTKDTKAEITIRKNMIMLAYQNDQLSFERFICTPDKVIISYHASMGDDGGSHVISLLNNEVKSNDYTIYDLKGNIAEISSDFIGDEGHTWSYGKLDLTTDSITWERTEH